LDAERIDADDMSLDHIGDHAGDDMGAEGGGIDLADTLDPVIGDELQEDEIAPAETRRRIADDEGLEVLDLHMSPQKKPGRRWHARPEKAKPVPFVIPAKAGIQGCKSVVVALDPSPDLIRGFRRGDGWEDAAAAIQMRSPRRLSRAISPARSCPWS